MNEDDPRCLALKREIAARLDAVYELGYRRFLCGMAIGCDMYFAEAVLALREKYGDVTLEAAGTLSSGGATTVSSTAPTR